MNSIKFYISRYVLVVFIILTSINCLKSQERQSASFDLNDCIGLAIQNSYQLQTDSILSESLKMTVKQEQAAYYPLISGELGFSGLFLSPYSFGQHYLQAVADWDLGKLWVKTSDIQQKKIERQKILQKLTKWEVIGVISGLYIDAQQNELELQILKSRLEYLGKHLNINTVLWKAGTNNQLDVLQTQSTINQLKEALMQKEMVAEQTKYVLSRLMGLNSEADFILTPIMGSQSLSVIEAKESDDFVTNHPSVQKLQKEYEVETLMKKEVRASLFPHVRAFSGFTFDGDPTADGNFVMLGLGASIPIYQGKKNNYRLSEIDINSDAIQSKKQNMERELSISHGQIIKQIQQYEKILDFQLLKVKTDEEVVNIAEINYKSGLSTNLEFLTAQQTLAETKLNISTVRNRHLKSLVSYYLLTGQIEKIKNLK